MIIISTNNVTPTLCLKVPTVLVMHESILKYWYLSSNLWFMSVTVNYFHITNDNTWQHDIGNWDVWYTFLTSCWISTKQHKYFDQYCRFLYDLGQFHKQWYSCQLQILNLSIILKFLNNYKYHIPCTHIQVCIFKDQLYLCRQPYSGKEFTCKSKNYNTKNNVIFLTMSETVQYI